MNKIYLSLLGLLLLGQEASAQSSNTEQLSLNDFIAMDAVLIVDGDYEENVDYDILRELYGAAIQIKGSSRNFQNEFERQKFLSAHKDYYGKMSERTFGDKQLPAIKERAFFPISDKSYDFEKQEIKFCPYFEQNEFRRWRDRYGSTDTKQYNLNLTVNDLKFDELFSFWVGRRGGCLNKKVPLNIAEEYINSAQDVSLGRNGFYGYVYLKPYRIRHRSFAKVDVSLRTEKIELEDGADGSVSVVSK